MKRIIVLFFITTLSACITLPVVGNNLNTDRRTDGKWVGRNIDELLSEIGEPGNIYPLDGGGRTLEYLKPNLDMMGIQHSSASTVSKKSMRPDEQIGLPGGQTSGQSLRTDERRKGQDIVPDGYVVLPDGKIASRRELRQQNLAQTLNCKIRLNITASDIIESWSAEGSKCR